MSDEFVQSLSHAEGSAAELDTQLMLSIELGYSTQETVHEVVALAAELRRMLNTFRRKLESCA
jgi:four helix bundle protein